MPLGIYLMKRRTAMVVTIRSLGLQGIAGYEVSVECVLSGGLPAFDVVGLPDAAVKESRERVRAAIRNCGAQFPVSRITINLAPAALRKEGTIYDLPILLGILAAQGDVEPPVGEAAFLGELSLTGALRPITGMLPMALAAVQEGVRELYVPAENAAEATLAGGLTVYPVEDVRQLLSHLRGGPRISPAAEWTPDSKPETGPDFADVMGQENVKRALEVAAAGGHNILLIGSPGSGIQLQNRIIAVVLPGKQRLNADAFKGCFKFLQGFFDFRNQGSVVFLIAHFQKGFDIFILSRKLGVDFHIILEAFQLFHLLLGTLGVVPEIWGFHFTL